MASKKKAKKGFKKLPPECDRCKKYRCTEGKDCFDIQAEYQSRYANDPGLIAVSRAAAAVESKHYGAATRLEEIAYFAREAGYSHLGLAFCVGFKEEARIVADLLRVHFKVTSVCCKVGAVPKKALRIPKLRHDEESICNPVAQAELMNKAGTELNVILGLCVGHDALFSRASEALVTTLVAKDRVLAHNPVGAIYCPYVKRRLQEGVFAPASDRE